jgi:tetratricopeptide (TPR) repeat protein
MELTPFPGQPVLQVLRQLYVDRESARLEVEHASGKQIFGVEKGELRLRAKDPLVEGLAAAPMPERLASLLRTIQRWSTPKVKIERGAPSGEWWVPGSTPALLLLAATTGREPRQLLEVLGGDAGRLEASASEQEMMRLPGIEPEDAFLFTRLATPLTVAELVAQSSLTRAETLGRLVRLRAVGLIAPPGGTKVELVAPSEKSAAPALLRRIAEDLEARPLRLMVGEHRDRVGKLLGRFGALDYYELLEVAPGATDDEVHRGFVELARLVHPSHAARLELHSGAGVLSVLFDRAVEAYLTLSDPRKRIAYNTAAGVTGMKSRKPAEELERERIRNARRSYELASELAVAEDMHFAVELLKQAVEADPRAEYFALLATCQARNENWRAQAAENARQAIARRPNDAGYRCLLARILEESGDGPGAIAAYNSALDVVPAHSEARAGLERLAAAKREALDAEGNILEKLRGMFRPRT